MTNNGKKIVQGHSVSHRDIWTPCFIRNLQILVQKNLKVNNLDTYMYMYMCYVHMYMYMYMCYVHMYMYMYVYIVVFKLPANVDTLLPNPGLNPCFRLPCGLYQI